MIKRLPPVPKAPEPQKELCLCGTVNFLHDILVSYKLLSFTELSPYHPAPLGLPSLPPFYTQVRPFDYTRTACISGLILCWSYSFRLEHSLYPSSQANYIWLISEGSANAFSLASRKPLVNAENGACTVPARSLPSTLHICYYLRGPFVTLHLRSSFICALRWDHTGSGCYGHGLIYTLNMPSPETQSTQNWFCI